MKKIIIFSIVFLAGSLTCLKAQTEKGKYFIGTFNQLGINFGSEKIKYDGEVDEDSKYSYRQINFTPEVGYTVIDNMPVGLFMYVDQYGEKDKSDDDREKTCSFAIGPFIRYYFADLVGLKPYAAAEVGFGFYREGYKGGDEDEWDKYKESYMRFKLGGGATYFFNDYVGIDLFLGYLNEMWTYKEDAEESYADKVKYIDNGFVFQMGVVCMLKCKK